MKGLIIREFTLRVSDSSFMQLQHFIMWQDSLEVNSNVLIGSFFVGFCHMGHFHGDTYLSCVSYVFKSLAQETYDKSLTNLQYV